jgi:hypothetical protein
VSGKTTKEAGCMKKISLPIAGLFVVLGAVLTGCATVGKIFQKTETVTYSFAEEGSPAVSIRFVSGNPGVSMVDYNDRKLPPAAEGTVWDKTRFFFPVDTALEITVHASYIDQAAQDKVDAAHKEQPGFLSSMLFNTIGDIMVTKVDKNVLFACPPLEEGKSYELEYERGLLGTSFLILRDATPRSGFYRLEEVCRQEF